MEHVRGNSEDAVYQKIKNAIRKRYIRQGSQLVEGSLAHKLGVSRTPVRSAIKRLEAEGLVNSIPNRGAFVITPTLQEIEETFFVRGHLEQMAARLSAAIITPGQITTLEELIKREHEVFNEHDFDEYYIVNDTFHHKIAEFSGNGVLTSYVGELLDRTRIFLILFDPFSKLSISPSLEDHKAIVAALGEHNPDKAAEAIATHIRSSVNDLETVDLMPDDYLSI
ncbi:MAG TPA: GntR family transcriptional regulator [Desulfopila sp.]|nr:GntR family transcriptional regulator [Desulfopila sp.]